MDLEHEPLRRLFPAVATQMRNSLGTLHLAASALAPTEERDRDALLDKRAAALDQSYYRLLRMVNNLTLATRLDRIPTEPKQNLDLTLWAENVCGQAAFWAESLDKTVYLKTSGACVVGVYRDLLTELLWQLLSNALKFTPTGGQIIVELKKQKKMVVLSVTDTGCGVETDKLAVLFDRYRHPELMDPPPYGFGLGLPICKRIAMLHEGSIMAESRVGEGFKAIVSLPHRRCHTEEISDVAVNYTGGFNPALLALADALPQSAFMQRNR